jgi:hypothetical protein
MIPKPTSKEKKERTRTYATGFDERISEVKASILASQRGRERYQFKCKERKRKRKTSHTHMLASKTSNASKNHIQMNMQQ